MSVSGLIPQDSQFDLAVSVSCLYGPKDGKGGCVWRKPVRSCTQTKIRNNVSVRLYSVQFWKAANGGAKRIVRFWGGGGERTIECAFQNQFWRPQKVGFAWSEPVSSKENNRTKTNGGKTYHRWGGPKPFLGTGFMVCFPLP